MGGHGSGRHVSLGMLVSKCEDYSRTLDVAWMKRHGCLEPGRSGELRWSRNGRQTSAVNYRTEQNGVRLIYKARSGDEPWKSINELVPFSFTATSFNGQRSWFLCPGCRRRCRILYGATYYRCRRCYGLKYESQYEPGYARAATQSHKLRAKLGQRGALDDPFPLKPKGMHWKTYQRLMDEDERLQLVWHRGLAGWLDAFRPQ